MWILLPWEHGGTAFIQITNIVYFNLFLFLSIISGWFGRAPPGLTGPSQALHGPLCAGATDGVVL